MSSKRSGRLCLGNGNENLEKYVSILENVLITSLEDKCGGSNFKFMDDNASYP